MTNDRSGQITYKLNQTAEFFGKTLSASQINVWMHSLRGYTPEAICEAFDQHFQVGKYMPRPAEIIDLMRQETHTRHARYQEHKSDLGHSDPRIATAWRIYLKHALSFEMPGDNEAMTLDEAIEIVNQQAVKYDMPDAIEPAYRLSEYWENIA